jgi:hypothetical protein
MVNFDDPFDDGLGPDLVDRGSAKEMGGGGGGGGFYDDSYEDALRIMGRGFEIPPPWEQRARTMDNADAAELARRLSLLRTLGGSSDPFGPPPTLGPASDTLAPDAPSTDASSADEPSADTGQAVEAFIAALQEVPPDEQRLADLRQQIDDAGGEIRDTLALVCEHPGVQDKLVS